jgi:hypothetical protein
MKDSIEEIMEIPFNEFFIKKICEIGLDICKSKIESSKMINMFYPNAENNYNLSYDLIQKGEYKLAFSQLEKAYNEYYGHNTDEESMELDKIDTSKNEIIIILITLITILSLATLIYVISKNKK